MWCGECREKGFPCEKEIAFSYVESPSFDIMFPLPREISITDFITLYVIYLVILYSVPRCCLVFATRELGPAGRVLDHLLLWLNDGSTMWRALL